MTWGIAASLLVALPAFAEPTVPSIPTVAAYRLVNIEASAVREVRQDQMEAVVFTEISQADPAQLARQINDVINTAMTTAKRYPQVMVSTGRQNTYPVYDDRNRQLKQWRGRAQLNLKSNDFTQLSALLAALQSRMQVENVMFSVSPALRQQTEDALLAEATQAFQKRANAIQQIWGAQRYELVNVEYRPEGSYGPRPMAAYRMNSAEASAIPAQQVEPGLAEIRLNAVGMIQLR